MQAVEAGQAAGHTGLSSGLFAIHAFTFHFFNIMRQMKSSIGAALAPLGPEEGVAQAASNLRVTTQTSASRAASRLEIALANQMEHSLGAIRELLWLFLVQSAADCTEWSCYRIMLPKWLCVRVRTLATPRHDTLCIRSQGRRCKTTAALVCATEDCCAPARPR